MPTHSLCWRTPATVPPHERGTLGALQPHIIWRSWGHLSPVARLELKEPQRISAAALFLHRARQSGASWLSRTSRGSRASRALPTSDPRAGVLCSCCRSVFILSVTYSPRNTTPFGLPGFCFLFQSHSNAFPFQRITTQTAILVSFPKLSRTVCVPFRIIPMLLLTRNLHTWLFTYRS